MTVRLRFLVTAGPTREPWDAVRFLSNGSSGRMGFEIARAAAARGHRVLLIAGPTEAPPPPGIRCRRVGTALEMRRAVLAAWRRADVLAMAAAVTDVRPAAPTGRKLKRPALPRSIPLLANPDILEEAGRRKGRRLVVGFALEDRLDRREARRKMAAKRADLLVLNTRRNLGSRDAAAVVLSPGRPPVRIRRTSKAGVARRLVRLIESAAVRRAPPPR